VTHKLLRVVHAVLRTNEPYRDPGIDYDALHVARNAPRWLRKVKEHNLLPPPVGCRPGPWPSVGAASGRSARRWRQGLLSRASSTLCDYTPSAPRPTRYFTARWVALSEPNRELLPPARTLPSTWRSPLLGRDRIGRMITEVP